MFGLKSRPTGPVAEPPRLVPGGDMPVMLRSGRPGSITDDQIDALQANQFLVPAPLSRLGDLSTDEAAAILAALAYARAATTQVTGEAAPTQVENQALALILADDAFTAHALRWVETGKPTPIRETAPFLRLKALLMGFWQAPQG